MNNTTIPPNADLPSGTQLVKSTLVAIAAASVILITAVLPAEYGVDPTGIGKAIGLTKMGEIKVSLARETAAEKEIAEKALVKADLSTNSNGPRLVLEKAKVSNDSSRSETVAESVKETVTTQVEAPIQSDETSFTLKPDEWREIKLKMNKGEQVSYVWWTDDGRANFDAHADSKKLKIDYHSYGKGSTDRKEGIMEAAFDGKHGWFWRNRTSKTMTITLQVKGDYSDIEGEV